MERDKSATFIEKIQVQTFLLGLVTWLLFSICICSSTMSSERWKQARLVRNHADNVTSRLPLATWVLVITMTAFSFFGFHDVRNPTDTNTVHQSPMSNLYKVMPNDRIRNLKTYNLFRTISDIDQRLMLTTSVSSDLVHMMF
jgi:hypothetical protein